MTQIRFIAATLLLSGSLMSYGQVKIKDGSAVADRSDLPGENAILELSSINKGVVFPRIALSDMNSPVPLSKHVQGMVVFNTAQKGNLSPGLYVNDGTKWLAVNAASAPASVLMGAEAAGDEATVKVKKLDKNTGKVSLAVGDKAFYTGFLPNTKGYAISNSPNVPKPPCLSGLVTLDAWAIDNTADIFNPAVTNKTGSNIYYSVSYVSPGMNKTNQNTGNTTGPDAGMNNPVGSYLIAGKSFPFDDGVYYNNNGSAHNELPSYFLSFKNPDGNKWESYLVHIWGSGSSSNTSYEPIQTAIAPYIKINMSVERVE